MGSSEFPRSPGEEGARAPPLPRSFFERPTLEVARDLLGKRLVFPAGAGWSALSIHEVEAYDGPADRACHACRGRTPRNEVLFGPAGHWYVYLCYGIHWLANLVTGPEGYPAAVLLRGAGGFDGPGKLTRAIGMTGAINRCPAAPPCPFHVADAPPVPRGRIRRTPRIGVAYAGPVWAAKRYRFLVD
ncbi:MAG: DNA-3-methyladenine glycosylase [Puniceicoccaceae bacterium]